MLLKVAAELYKITSPFSKKKKKKNPIKLMLSFVPCYPYLDLPLKWSLFVDKYPVSCRLQHTTPL